MSVHIYIHRVRYIQFIETACTDKDSHSVYQTLLDKFLTVPVIVAYIMSTEKMKSRDLKGSEDLTEPAGSSSASPATTEKTSPTG